MSLSVRRPHRPSQGPSFELEVPGGSFQGSSEDLDRPRPAGGPAFRSEDAARYIAERSGALAAMAREMNLDLVAYLLDIAQLEASRTGTRINSDRP